MVVNFLPYTTRRDGWQAHRKSLPHFTVIIQLQVSAPNITSKAWPSPKPLLVELHCRYPCRVYMSSVTPQIIHLFLSLRIKTVSLIPRETTNTCANLWRMVFESYLCIAMRVGSKCFVGSPSSRNHATTATLRWEGGWEPFGFLTYWGSRLS